MLDVSDLFVLERMSCITCENNHAGVSCIPKRKGGLMRSKRVVQHFGNLDNPESQGFSICVKPKVQSTSEHR